MAPDVTHVTPPTTFRCWPTRLENALRTLDAATGEERWSVDLALDTGYTAPIALVGDTVVLGSERFDATSGAIAAIA